MALQGPIPVQFSQVYPHGAFAAGVIEPVRDFDASKDGRFVQAKDRESGLPLWAVDVIDADPAARTKDGTGQDRIQRPAHAAPARPGDAVHPGRADRPDGHPICQPGRSAGLLPQGDGITPARGSRGGHEARGSAA
jgi:hypothetical protein